jgi:hypothetical protein
MVTFKIKGKNYHVFRFGKRTIFVLNSNLKNFEKTKRTKMFTVNSIGNYYYVPSTVSPKKKKKSSASAKRRSTSTATGRTSNINRNESARLTQGMRNFQNRLTREWFGKNKSLR